MITLFTRFVGRINRAELVGLTLILTAGFALVRAGTVTVGETAAAAVLFHRLFNPVSMILYTFDEIQAAGASLARLVGVGTLPVAPAGTIALGEADLRLDRVSFVPAAVPPHRKAPTASAIDRYAMVALATASDPSFVPWDGEIRRWPLSSV